MYQAELFLAKVHLMLRFQNNIGHMKESIQRAVPTYALWEGFRWMAVFESFFFFVSSVYFLAETLQPDEDKCTLTYKDGFWAYFCLVTSALSMLIVFGQEDRYLIPRKSYDVNLHSKNDVSCKSYKISKNLEN